MSMMHSSALQNLKPSSVITCGEYGKGTNVKGQDVVGLLVLFEEFLCTDYLFLIHFPKRPILDLCPSSLLIHLISDSSDF